MHLLTLTQPLSFRCCQVEMLSGLISLPPGKMLEILPLQEHSHILVVTSHSPYYSESITAYI